MFVMDAPATTCLGAPCHCQLSIQDGLVDALRFAYHVATGVHAVCSAQAGSLHREPKHGAACAREPGKRLHASTPGQADAAVCVSRSGNRPSGATQLQVNGVGVQCTLNLTSRDGYCCPLDGR